jgi:Na+:H+ antiporter, NhaA family
MKLTKLFNEFFHSEKSGGLTLIFCTIISLILANSFLHEFYLSVFNFPIAHHSVTHWINDGLMTIFFLLIGLELEREIYIGELSDLRKSLLPIVAALGGMILPAALHLVFNYGTPTQRGAGIPMATDIAFALGILSLLGNRVPPALKVFLTALAVIDDLGAIIIIAAFYTDAIHWTNLFIAFGIFGGLLILNRLKVHTIIPYLIAGVVMWYFMLHSGVHATITGVLLAFAIPFGDGSETSPSYKLQQRLHLLVAFVILPIFALANTGIRIDENWYKELLQPNSIGIALGLLVGKTLGILGFSYIAVKAGLCLLPEKLNFRQIFGTGFLGGIGFTMAIFTTLLAFEDPSLIEQSKMAVMIASVISGSIGYVILKVVLNEEYVNGDTT